MESNEVPASSAPATFRDFDLNALYQHLRDLKTKREEVKQAIHEIGECLTSAGNGEHEDHDRETTHADPTDALKLLAMQHLKLCSLDRRLGRIEDTMREVSVRSLNILDLPNEILTKIFENNIEHYRNTPRVKNIQLTCRRFYNTSCHLLLDHVHVEMNPRSLAQFEEISRHPLISKGIHCVNVSANFYNSARPDKIIVFSHFHFIGMREEVVSHEQIWELLHRRNASSEALFDFPRRVAKLEIIVDRYRPLLLETESQAIVSEFLDHFQTADDPDS